MTKWLLITMTLNATGAPQADVYERDTLKVCREQAAAYIEAGIAAVCVRRPAKIRVLN